MAYLSFFGAVPGEYCPTEGDLWDELLYSQEPLWDEKINSLYRARYRHCGQEYILQSCPAGGWAELVRLTNCPWAIAEKDVA